MDGGEADAYYHPFTLPAGYEDRNLAPYWLEDPVGRSFASSMCFQVGTLRQWTGTQADHNSRVHRLGKLCLSLGRRQVRALSAEALRREASRQARTMRLSGCNPDDAGDISHLLTKAGEKLAADLYIDCSGFSSLLIGKHFGVPFLSRKDVLFIDRAWAVQVPYPTDEAAINSVTVATAQSSGWVWDIGLTTRRGVGYVFSSGHVSDEAALEELKNYLSARGDLSRDLSYRKIDINSGYRREFWTRNCVAVGLSAGFIEPLEASAIVMIELSAKSIANLLPSGRGGMRQAARIFNDTFRYRWGAHRRFPQICTTC